MPHESFRQSLIVRLSGIPLRVYLIIAATLLVGWYILLFVVPRQVEFNYASSVVCLSQATPLPALYREVDGIAGFKVTNESTIDIGSLSLASTKTCLSPRELPGPGRYMVAISPFGGWLFRQNVVIRVAEVPTASIEVLKVPVPVSKPLSIELSSPDRVHTYLLEVGARKAACTSLGRVINCDLPKLALEQGQKYAMKLTRQFASSAKSTVLTQDIHTLTATKITEASVKDGEVVYARPQQFSFVADKPLRKATVRIKKSDDSKVITAKTDIDGPRLSAVIDTELTRDSDYSVTVEDLEAVDGSSLVESYQVKFHMSGGPKVIGVNVAKSGVGTSARVVVTFDQELSTEQDISKLVTFSGGSAVVGRAANELTFQLQSLPLCAPFTLTVAKGLSSKYDILSAEPWSYTSRTICYTTAIYGYSVQGRPLVAYYFGSGSPTTMYVGAIHGNEVSSSGLMRAWIDHLEANPNLYDGKRIVVVPTINPDGVARGSRTNARGVNLNRNFPTSNWISDIDDTDGRHAGGGGSAPLSEPEASALATLTTNVRPRLLLSFHAIGSLVVGDPGGYSAGYAARYASMVGYRDATGQGGTFDYDITGAYEDWTYANRGIPSMVIELGSYGYFNFAHHRSALEAMLP